MGTRGTGGRRFAHGAVGRAGGALAAIEREALRAVPVTRVRKSVFGMDWSVCALGASWVSGGAGGAVVRSFAQTTAYRTGWTRVAIIREVVSGAAVPVASVDGRVVGIHWLVRALPAPWVGGGSSGADGGRCGARATSGGARHARGAAPVKAGEALPGASIGLSVLRAVRGTRWAL